MDFSTISSITSASTKLMLAGVKARATESTGSSSSSSSSTSTASSTSSTDTASTTAAATSSATSTTSTTTTTTTDDTATKVAELEAKLEQGKSLTTDEVKYLNTNSPGTYQRILNSLTEKTDYVSLLSGTTTDGDALAVHMNKLSDMLTEAKAISNDSSLSSSDKFSQLQSLSSRVNSIEDLTYQYGLGSTSSDGTSAFKSMLSTISDAKQQSIIYKYNPSFATTDADTTASAKSSASSSTSGTTSTSASTASASSTSTASSGTTSSSSTKSVSDTLAEIRSIISTETANAALSGVKTAGLNLLV